MSNNEFKHRFRATWVSIQVITSIISTKDCEAGRNPLLLYYPKYPLMCEMCAVVICDNGFSEERTLTHSIHTQDDGIRCH